LHKEHVNPAYLRGNPASGRRAKRTSLPEAGEIRQPKKMEKRMTAREGTQVVELQTIVRVPRYDAKVASLRMKQFANDERAIWQRDYGTD
jgi:hypothetical protein